MSRSTQHQRLPMIARRRVTTAEVMVKFRREVKRRLIADGMISDPATQPPKYEWHWELGDRGGVVLANTRGEARSQIKTDLGINTRLPTNITIVRVTPSADSRASVAACSIGAVQG